MSTLGWFSDPHLDGCSLERIDEFAEELRALDADAWIATGDLAESDTFAEFFERVAMIVKKPMYFLLGNHDYFYSSFAKVHETAKALHERSEYARWIRLSRVVKLSEKSALVGHDGFADRRAGTVESKVLIGDQYAIEDFKYRPRETQIRIAREEADRSAMHLLTVVPEAMAWADTVYVALHAPPFAQAARHNRQEQDPEWAPHFVNVAAGRVLKELAEGNPTKKIIVLCGHTHERCTLHVRGNLIARVAESKYHHPRVEDVIRVDRSA